MGSNWCFVSARRLRSRNRLTPPLEVRDKVVTKHLIDDACVYWNYDPETGLGLVSDCHDPKYVEFGRSKLDNNNAIVIDSGLIDAAFNSVAEGDSMVFVGTEELVYGDQTHLYILHENQLYDLLKNPN